jgi:hypothetical protein
VVTPRQLRDEARTCRALASEIKDPAGIAMMLERAEQLERRAAAQEKSGDPPKPVLGTAAEILALRRPPRAATRQEPNRRTD